MERKEIRKLKIIITLVTGKQINISDKDKFTLIKFQLSK